MGNFKQCLMFNGREHDAERYTGRKDYSSGFVVSPGYDLQHYETNAYKQSGYEGVDVWVKCGANHNFAYSISSAVLSIIGSILGAVPGLSPVAAAANVLASQIALAGALHDELEGTTAAADLDRALETEYVHLKPGQTHPKHWGSLSLIQECTVVYPDGTHQTKSVWTAWCHNCNNEYKVRQHWGTGGRRRAEDEGEDENSLATPNAGDNIPEWLTKSGEEEMPFIDYLVGAWENIDGCTETSAHCQECLPCVECFENPSAAHLSLKCMKCAVDCMDCVNEVPCLLHDSLEDCESLEIGVENEAEVPDCFQHCHDCTRSGSFCEECEACESTLKAASLCLGREAHLKYPHFEKELKEERESNGQEEEHTRGKPFNFNTEK